MFHHLLIIGSAFAMGLTVSGADLAPAIELVSKPYTNIAHTFGDSSGIELSADARWALFSSNGNGLTTNDNNGFNIDLFLQDLQTGERTLITRGLSGSSANGDSVADAFSADGRFVLFESDADDLVPGDDNESTDLFLYDRTTGQTTVISKSTAGVADGNSGAAVMTADARFILFESDADDLSPLDANDAPDLYLLDRQNGAVQLITLNSNNTAAASAVFPNPFLGQFEGAVSGDGRWVAYISSATNVVRGVPVNAPPQLFLRDTLGQTNAWISRATSGQGAASVAAPELSDDGTILAFLSTSLDAVPTQTSFLYIYKTATGELRKVQAADEFSLSADGLWIAYVSANQVYLCDVAGQTNQLVTPSVGLGATPLPSTNPVLSPDGRVLLFTSAATNLVGNGSTNVFYQLYRFDRTTGQIALLTPGMSGGGANRDALYPVVSADGSTAGFMSFATDLTADDEKNANDVFIVSTSGTNAVQLVSSGDPRIVSATASGGSTLENKTLSIDGRYLVFTSSARDVVPNDDNEASDVFIRDLRTGTTRLVSVSSDGVHPLPGGSNLGTSTSSGYPNGLGISADGRKVLFLSKRPGSVNAAERALFIYDVSSGTNSLVSVLPSGETAGNVLSAFLSPDSGKLAFVSANGTTTSLFLRDLSTTTTTLLTNFSRGDLAGFSPSGTYLIVAGSGVASTSIAFDLRTGGARAFPGGITAWWPVMGSSLTFDDQILVSPRAGLAVPLYLYSLAQGTTNLISTNFNSAGLAAVSVDGSTVVYQGAQPVNGTNSSYIYIYDRASGSTAPLNLPSNSLLRIRSSPVLTADGRYIALSTTNGLSPSSGGRQDILVYDRLLTNFVSLSAGRADQSLNDPFLSAAARIVAFQSPGSTLVSDDRNDVSDVFIARLPMADSNQNGIDDGWETQSFGGTTADPTADPDHDGMTNQQEFRAGTNPNQASSALSLSTVTSAGDRITLQWPAVIGKSYQLQFRTDLTSGAWTDLGPVQVAFSNALTYQVPPGSSPAAFFRIKLVE